MGVQQRLGYEMNRQLQADSELSLADYDVLNALSGVPDERMQVGTTSGSDRMGAEPPVSSRQANAKPRTGAVRPRCIGPAGDGD